MLKKERLVFFGDSICVGQGISIHNGWVTRISAMIEKNCENIEVVNSSVNGRTTRQAIEDMPYHVQSCGTSVLVLQFGLNDCNYWKTDGGLPRVSKEAFIANIKEMVTRGITFGAKRVIINNNHSTLCDREKFSNTNVNLEDSNKQYNSILRVFSKKNDFNERIIFNDIEQAFFNYTNGDRNKLEELVLPDGVHLSKKGHDLYFDIVYPSIQKALL